MRRRTFLAASAANLALPAVGGAASSRLLKYAAGADLVAVDPIWTIAYQTRNHGYMVFDTLYGQTGKEHGFKVTPQMVAGHTVENDGKTWKLTLRDGLLFHDGERVLARDCVASIRRWAVRDAFGQALMERTDELSAADDRTIIFRLRRSFPLLPDALGHGATNMCAMMPQRIASTDPFKPFTEVVGSGPFRFKADERVQGSLFVYERFADYRPREGGGVSFTAGPKIVHFDRIEWHIQPDPATKAAALQTGEIDWWDNPTADLLPLLRRHNIQTPISDPSGVLWWLRPNHLHPPFDNPSLRRALMGAIDQTEFMTAMVGPDNALWEVPVGYFPPSSPQASAAGMPALTGKRDDAAVRRALRAAGYKGEKLTLLVPTDVNTMTALSNVAADMLKRVGMNVDYQATDFGKVVQRRTSTKPPAEGGWNLLCIGASGLDAFTPATHLSLRGNGKGAGYGWPNDPKLEELRESWLDAPDLPAQQKIAKEIQLQAFHSVPYYPLGLTRLPTAVRPDITGVLQGFALFWNVRRI
jgi:peptide/nickel transport system substrate-binding protein